MPNCPHCKHELTPADVAKLMRQIHSDARSEASKRNGAKNDGSKSTGRPPGAKDKHKRKSNRQLAKALSAEVQQGTKTADEAIKTIKKRAKPFTPETF